MSSILKLALVLAAFLPHAGAAETPVETAKAWIARYHEDPTLLDRARDVLLTALQTDRQVDTMITLARTYFQIGDVRARSTDEKLAAYERGRDIGRRAIELAPRNEDAERVAPLGRDHRDRGRIPARRRAPETPDHRADLYRRSLMDWSSSRARGASLTVKSLRLVGARSSSTRASSRRASAWRPVAIRRRARSTRASV